MQNESGNISDALIDVEEAFIESHNLCNYLHSTILRENNLFIRQIISRLRLEFNGATLIQAADTPKMFQHRKTYKQKENAVNTSQFKEGGNK